ncbi:MAG: RsmB/NOP family class I SAM-dependent RNA methyltransferase [Streptosporangiaceae bacterium]
MAYDELWAVDQRDAYANLLLPALLRERGIEGRDAALATELTYGTLRGLQTYDAILNQCSDRSPGDIDPPVREVLRLGTHQLLATRVASHAAVATSVDLAKDVAGMRPAGFVNAVLRRVSTRAQAEWLEIIAPDRASDPIGYLAATCSYPRWIVEAFRAALGEEPAGGLPETGAALAAGNVRPRITLAALPALADRKELIGERATGREEPVGQGTAEPAQPARWSPFGVILPGGDPSAIPAVAEGRVFVQDEASQLASLALAHAPLAAPPAGREPADREPATAEPAGSAGAATAGPWLDLCAGPGGKSAVLAALAAPDGAHLLASDVRPHRAELTRAHLRHLPSAAVVTADGRAGAWRPGSFDRVLADVPCSGLGALRRRPEARWRKSPEDVEELGTLQRALLHAALDATRPGGVTGYVTCSPHLAETHDVVRDVLAARSDVSVLDAPAVLAAALRAPGAAGPRPAGLGIPAPGAPHPGSAGPGIPAPGAPGPGSAEPEIPDLRSPGPDGRYAQFWPHRHGTDAIFLALLRRTPAASQ